MSQLYSFVERTKKSTHSEKDTLRFQTVQFIHNYFLENGMRTVKFLTLPSVWWRFEKIIRIRFRLNVETRVKASFVSCERDWKLFCLAAIRLPKSNKPIRQKLNAELNCQVVTNGSFAVIVNCDIFDYIKSTDKKFDCVWIDATCAITDLAKGLLHVGKCCNDKAIVIITFMKGRERTKLPTDRLSFASAIMAKSGLELVKVDEYSDSTPMIQMLFKRA